MATSSPLPLSFRQAETSSMPAQDEFLIQYHHSPCAQPVPFSLGDFAIIEEVRDILPELKFPSCEPDFLLVCKDDRISYSQWYGILIHRNVFWKNSSSAMRSELEKGKSASGFQFGLQPVSVLHVIIIFLYTGTISYDPDSLPFSEAELLIRLYRTAVNRGMVKLADAAYSHLRQPQTQIGDAADVKNVIQMVLYSSIGKKAAGAKRTTEIREAVIESFACEILERLDEDSLVQFCKDNEQFAKMMLEAVMATVRRVMWKKGVELDELD